MENKEKKKLNIDECFWPIINHSMEEEHNTEDCSPVSNISNITINFDIQLNFK